MLKVWVLFVVIGGMGDPRSLAVVDNIATKAQCEALGKSFKKDDENRTNEGVRFNCYEVEKAR